MTDKKATKVKEQVKPVSTGHNVNPAYDVLCARGSKIKALWDKADKAQGSADAHAALLLVEAHEFGFFDQVNVRDWTKIATARERNSFSDIVLIYLFGIEKPEPADRQRLQRIRFVVPAIIDAGGSKAAKMSKSGAIMLDADSKYFKACPTGGQEVQGFASLSIAKLSRGGKKLLAKELPKQQRAPQTATGQDRTPAVKLVELAQITEGKVSALSDGAASLDNSTSKALQSLLVALMGVFAEDTAGGIDTTQLVKMYKAA